MGVGLRPGQLKTIFRNQNEISKAQAAASQRKVENGKWASVGGASREGLYETAAPRCSPKIRTLS